MIGGPASRSLARKVARRLGGKFIDSKVRTFPDGENKVTITGVPRGDAVVIQSTHPPVDSNLIQLLSLISKAKKTASRVTAIVPYLCYMRQDIEFLPGEMVTSKVVARMLQAAGADRVITVDIHSTIAMNYFDVQIKNTSAVPDIASCFKKLKLKNPIVVAPDLFWSNKAKELADALNTGYMALNKQRDRKTGKLRIIQKKKADLSNRDVILLDDMISTGNSMVKAARYVRAQKCARIFAACTHALLVDDAEANLRAAGISEIVSTNTVSGTTNRIDVSRAIADSYLDL